MYVTTKVFAKLESQNICAAIPPKTVLEDDVINKAAYMLDEEEILSKNCKNLSRQRMLHHQKKKVGEKRRVMGIFNQKTTLNSELKLSLACDDRYKTKKLQDCQVSKE